MVFFSSCRSVDFHHEFFEEHCKATVLSIHVSMECLFIQDLFASHWQFFHNHQHLVDFCLERDFHHKLLQSRITYLHPQLFSTRPPTKIVIPPRPAFGKRMYGQIKFFDQQGLQYYSLGIHACMHCIAAPVTKLLLSTPRFICHSDKLNLEQNTKQNPVAIDLLLSNTLQ